MLRTVLTTLSLLMLGLWLGAELMFIQLAGVAFTRLPPLFSHPADGIHGAGLVVAGTLAHLHYMGMALGLLFLVMTVLLRGVTRWHSIVPQAILVLLMLVLTAYSQFSVIPRMDTAQASAGGSVAALPENSPARATFDALHRQSVHLESMVLIAGFVAFLLTGRPHTLRSELR
jgi:hypothetical protein